MLICEYCNGQFSRSGNLKKHQQTAKYCQKLQAEKESRDSQLTCNFCEKVLSRSDSLHRHYNTCLDYQIHLKTAKLEEEVKQLKERLKEKDDYIRELTGLVRDRPTVQVNVAPGNPLDQTELYQQVMSLFRDHPRTISN